MNIQAKSCQWPFKRWPTYDDAYQFNFIINNFVFTTPHIHLSLVGVLLLPPLHFRLLLHFMRCAQFNFTTTPTY